MDIMDLILQLATNSTVVTFILSVIPAPYLAAVIATLTVLLILSELLAKLPTKYNAIYQVIADIAKKLLSALKRAPTPEKLDPLAARVEESEQGGEAAASKMKQALEADVKKRSEDLLGQ